MRSVDEADLLFGKPIPMARVLGLVGEEIRPDYARIRMPHNRLFTNNRGGVHGGALMTLLDCALACSVRSIDPAVLSVITVDLTTHFIASSDGPVIAHGRCVRRGASLCFAQGEVLDAQGGLLATATGAFKLARR